MGDAAFQDRYVDIGNVHTRYWTAGEKGSVVILLHGVGCHVEFWEKNIAALAQEHRVFAIDIVGFGRTDKPAAFYASRQMAYMTSFVLDFMDVMEIEKASLVGNSMGGGITIKAAARFPDRMEKVVLVDSAGLGRRIAAALRILTIPWVGEVLTRPSRRSALRFLKMVAYDQDHISEGRIDRCYAISRICGNQRSLLSVIRDSFSLTGMKQAVLADFSSCLTKITAPTLVIWGRQDRILPVADALSTVEKAANVRLHIIDRAGHSPQMDRPHEFNATVLDFLRD